MLALVPEKGVRNGLIEAEAMAKINADYPDTLVCSKSLTLHPTTYPLNREP